MIKIKKGNVKIKGYNDELTLDFISALDGFRELDNRIIAESSFKKEIKELMFNVKFNLPDFKKILGMKRDVKKYIIGGNK